MLNPEVEKFSAPESHQLYSCGSWSINNPHDLINQHPFITQISVLLPDCGLPGEMRDVLTKDTEFYHVIALSSHLLCDPTFVQAFVNTGKVYGVSCDTRLDLDDCAALTPDGRLRLLLSKFTYQRLPLSGKLSRTILRTPKDKFVVDVNLKDEGSNRRASAALKQTGLEFNWWLAWLPDDPEVCPSSLAKYFQDQGLCVRECQTTSRQTLTENAVMPWLAFPGGEDVEQEGMEPEELLEWIGCQALGIHLSGEDTNSCGVRGPQSGVAVADFCSAHYSGFFPPSTVATLINSIKSWLEGKSEKAVPWVSVIAYGHPDSPVSSAQGREHRYGANGDNLYTLVIGRGGVRTFTVSGPNKPARLYVKANKNK